MFPPDISSTRAVDILNSYDVVAIEVPFLTAQDTLCIYLFLDHCSFYFRKLSFLAVIDFHSTVLFSFCRFPFFLVCFYFFRRTFLEMPGLSPEGDLDLQNGAFQGKRRREDELWRRRVFGLSNKF